MGVHEQPASVGDCEERGGGHPSRADVRLRLPDGVHRHRVRHATQLQPDDDRQPDRLQGVRRGDAHG